MIFEGCISVIAAVSSNGFIGRDNDLPWRLSADLKNFKSLTLGKPMIMGRKTFRSLGGPLPGRPHIVLSRDPNFRYSGVDSALSFNEALIKAAEISGRPDSEVMVIGGETVFSEALPLATRLYITEVHMDVSGDARFPPFDRREWVEISREKHLAAPKETADYSFVVLDRLPGTVHQSSF
ncbi:MAG: dihydrofolate reductase [Rhodospirillaceae bacterium]